MSAIADLSLALTLALTLAEHGHGLLDASPWMWAVWVVAAGVTVWSIWAAVRTTLRPGEESPEHVKRSILSDDDVAPAVPDRAPASRGSAR